MSSPRPQPQTILYVAATESGARDGAAALEAVDAGPDRSVHPTVDVETVRERAPHADCVVFAETPTTTAGAHLLEVAEACDATPLVLFTDAAYGSTAARSTDGIDGYVRRNTAGAVAHLADQIDWVCHGADAEAEAETGGSDEERNDDAVVAEPAADGSPDRPSVDALLEAATEIAACRDRERLFDLLVETAAGGFGLEYCWLATVNFGEFVPRAAAPALPDDAVERTPLEGPLGDAFRAGESLRIDDLAERDDVAAPVDGVRSLCSVPIGDVGVFQAAAETPNAFDERDRELFEGFCAYAAAILERDRAATRLASERDRLDRERERLVAERDRLAAERDDLAAERDRLLELFANVPEPALRYELEDGEPIVTDVNDTFEAVFGVDRETVVGDRVATYTVPSGLEERTAALAESLRAGERRQLVRRRETADGVREFVLTLVPLEADADGLNPEGMLVYSDVTESKRSERELAAATDRLERVGELLDEEVRSPLNVARGYLELAQETGDREHFAEIERAHRRLLELVDRLHGVARDDDVLVDTEPVSVADAARRAWVGVDADGAKLVTDGDLLAEADRGRLRELLEYALQAAVEGEAGAATADDERERDDRDDGDGEPVTVTVGTTDDGFYVAGQRPETGDDGAEGAPASGRLTAADGTGFQLGPVERIADAHGWDVGVAADDGGTAFAFRGVDAVKPR